MSRAGVEKVGEVEGEGEGGGAKVKVKALRTGIMTWGCRRSITPGTRTGQRIRTEPVQASSARSLEIKAELRVLLHLFPTILMIRNKDKA